MEWGYRTKTDCTSRGTDTGERRLQIVGEWQTLDYVYEVLNTKYKKG